MCPDVTAFRQGEMEDLLAAEAEAYHTARAVKPSQVVDCERCGVRWAWVREGQPALCSYCEQEGG